MEGKYNTGPKLYHSRFHEAKWLKSNTFKIHLEEIPGLSEDKE